MGLIDDLLSNKIKPEFGNIEHINALKNYVRNECGVLKKYRVTICMNSSHEYIVEAEDESQARLLAMDDYCDITDFMDDPDIDIENVEEIKE